MNATTEVTTTEYLNEIKFRNAVKRTLGSVIGKNSYDRSGYTVNPITSVDGGWFTVGYMTYGTIGKMNEESVLRFMQTRENMIYSLIEAGFETKKIEITKTWGGVKETTQVRVWRKAAK
jgi:hypothetical protein